MKIKYKLIRGLYFEQLKRNGDLKLKKQQKETLKLFFIKFF